MATTLEAISRRSIRQLVTAWTPGIKPTWTIAEVRNALALHRQGDFSQSALLVDTMGEDDCISSVLEKRVDALLQSDFQLQAVDKPNRQLSKRIAGDLEPCWWDYFPESELDELLRWYRMLGVGIAVLDWTMTSSSWTPTLRVLHPQYLRYDEERGKWFYYAREGELEVTPGDGRWVMLIDGRRGWMRGSVRPMALPWIARQLTLRDWNRFNERHGFPLILARAPAIADDADRDQFWEDVGSLQSEAVAQLITHLDDNGAQFDLDLLEATDKSYDSFKLHLEYIDRRITVHFLGGNLSTEVVNQGARAASDTHHGVEREKASADGKKTSTALRKQALTPIVMFNYPGAIPEVTPWPEWDTTPTEDDGAKADAAKKFGESLKAIQDAGYDVENVDEIAEKHGLKLVKREQPEPVVPTPPDGQGPGEADADDSGTDDSDDDEPGDGDDAGAENRSGNRRDDRRGSFAVRLASGAAIGAGTSGFLSGQLYVDAVAEAHAEAATKELKPLLADVEADIKGAESYGDLRERLHKRFEEANPDELNILVYQAIVLGALAGKLAVVEDT
jgi:phage gp29-like protein